MFTVGRSIVVGRVVEPDPGESILTGFGALAGVSLTLRGLVTGIATHAVGLRALDWRALSAGHDQDALTRALEQTILRLDFAYGALIENLTLDANGEVDYAAMLYSGVGEPRPEQTHAITLRGCTFRGARRVQVQFGPPQIQGTPPTRPRTVGVGAEQVMVQIPSEIVTTGNGDIPGLNVRNCVVECRAIEALDPPRGMHFRTENGVALRVADTVFRGPTQCFIDITSGMVLVDGCDFDNPSSSTESAGQKTMTIASGYEPPEGQDVYLGALGSLSNGSPPQSGNGFVAMSSCTSNSAQLMATPYPSRQGINNGRPMRSNLIWGCRHEPPGTSGSVSVRWGRLALAGRVDSGSERRYNSDGTLCVVGGYMGGEIQAVTRAAQSVVLACRTSATDNLPKIVAPRPPGTRSMTTVIFGLQCVALLLLILGGVGCQQEPRAASTDIGVDRVLGAEAEMPAIDAGHSTRVDNGARADVRARPDVVIADPPDSGVSPDAGERDTAAMDGAVDDATRDAPYPDIPGCLDPEWAMVDVVRRDIEVTPLPDASIIEDAGPPRQMRADCPVVTDGDTTIAAPRLLFPMSPMRATSQRPTLFWALPPGVDGARVELCLDRCCTRVITTLDVSGSSARPQQALPPGVVFWRARGKIGTRFGRETSFTWEFGVKHRDAPTDTAWGTIRDFNGDGFDDLVELSSQVRLYWGGVDGIAGSRFSAHRRATSGGATAIGDFDGDGLADLLAETSTEEYPGDDGINYLRTVASVYIGRAFGGVQSTPRLRMRPGMLTVCDLNGDGYSDAVHMEEDRPRSTGEMRPRIVAVFGGPQGLGSGGRQIVDDPLGFRRWPLFGALSCPGDLDQDGYAELLVGDASVPDTGGAVYVFRGGREGASEFASRRFDATSLAQIPYSVRDFGVVVGSVGDVDGDRLGDVGVVSWFQRQHIFLRGNRTSFVEFAVSVSPPDRDQAPYRFGRLVDVSPDLDGDGRADPVLACPSCGTEDFRERPYYRGFVYVYQSTASEWLGVLPIQAYRGGEQRWEINSTFGSAVASGDFDGDGFDDIAIGDPESWPDLCAQRGVIHLVLGGADLSRARRISVFGESRPLIVYPGLGWGLASNRVLLSAASGA
jgi:hypothetical protein